jgi:glucokinase-like ROK family protein
VQQDGLLMLKQPTSIKAINQRRVLHLLRVSPGISRVEIASRTGLGKATVSSMVSEFIAQGVVYEDGVASQPMAAVGRRPVRLRLNAQARLAIGVELTGTECIATLTDLCAEPLRVIRCPVPDMSPDAAVGTIAQCVHGLLEDHNPTNLLGVGVGVPGQVDPTRQRVIQAINVGWFDVPLGTMLGREVGRTVILVKRQNAGVLGEFWYGIGRGHDDLVYVSVGVGIGCGLIVRGELHEGTAGSAGELGHVTVVPDGHRCRCGNHGCLETVASSSAAVIRAREQAKEGRRTLLLDWNAGMLESVTIQQVIQAALQGDALAAEVIREAAHYLGLGIADIVNLFNPSLVIIGGEMLEAGELYLEAVREETRRRSLSIPQLVVKVVPTSLGYRGPSIGAATLVIDRFFALSGTEEGLGLEHAAHASAT